MLLEDKNAVIYGGGGSIGGALDGGDAVLRVEAGDQTDQESRSEGTEPQVD